jgi:hypothetical protein
MKFLLATLLLGLMTIGVAAQEKTIPEKVRAGLPAGADLTIDYANLYLDQLADQSDLIVRGLITGTNSHLTKDERWIQTDYNVLVLERLHARGTIKHGQTIVVSRFGGTVEVEGKKVTMSSGFPPFQIGDEYVFFLNPRPDGTFSILAGPYGLFKNVSGEVEQVGQGTYKDAHREERGHVPMGLFIQELNDAINHGLEHGQGRGNNK